MKRLVTRQALGALAAVALLAGIAALSGWSWAPPECKVTETKHIHEGWNCDDGEYLHGLVKKSLSNPTIDCRAFKVTCE